MNKLLLGFLLACAFCTNVHAHLFPKQHATIKVVESAASLVVAVPVSALQGVDDDQNGFLSPQEMQRHKTSIQDQFVARFRVSCDGEAGASFLTWAVPPQTDGPPTNSDYIVLLHRVRFSTPPAAIEIETDLFGTKAGESELKVNAKFGKASETAVLSVDAPSYVFSRG